MTYPNTYSFIVILSFICSIFATQQLLCQEYTTEKWRFVDELYDIGLANFIEFDVDQDGSEELIYSSVTNYSERSLIHILEHTNSNEYRNILSSDVLNSGIKCMQKYDLNGNGTFHLYVSDDESKIMRFDIETLKLLDTISISYNADKFFYVDGNQDGSHELVYVSDGTIYVVDSMGNELFSMEVHGYNDMEVGDVDNDGEIELVVSGDDAFVIGLSDYEEEWTYLGGFDDKIFLQDIDGSGKELIFTSGYYSRLINCYDAELKTTLWQIEVNGQIVEMEVLDYNNNGQYEILVGTGSSYKGIKCYSLLNRKLIWERDPPSSSITDFSVGDFDNDGNYEIVYGCGFGSSSEDLLVIYDPVSQSEWTSTDYTDGFLLDLIDVNEDHVHDLFISSISLNGNFDSGSNLIFDGASKSLLASKINPWNYVGIVDITTVKYEGSSYLATFSDGRVLIYNYNAGKVVVDESEDKFDNIVSGSFEYFEGKAFPYLVLAYLSGEVKFFGFDGTKLLEKWSTPKTFTPLYDFKIDDFDADNQVEIAILNPGILSIYNTNSHHLEKQFQLTNSEARTFEIEDIDRDGVKDLIYHAGGYGLAIEDYHTGDRFVMPINDNSIKSIKVANLDTSSEYEVVILSDDRICMYQNNGITLFNSPLLNMENNKSNEALHINDYDKDGHTEILTSTFFGVYEFEITEEYLDHILPVVESYSPPDGLTLKPMNSFFEIHFSEKIDTIGIESHIVITNSNGEHEEFVIDFKNDHSLLRISPQTTWPATDTLTISLKKEITDISNNTLDGNYNGVADSTDDFTFTLAVGQNVDTVGPTLMDLQVSSENYRGLSVKLSGNAVDTLRGIGSNISYFEYFLDEEVMRGNGISMKPVDNLFNEPNESFEVKIPTTDLQSGDHEIKIIARDTLRNWSKIVKLNFYIIPEDAANWTNYGFDVMNTSANPHSELKGEMDLKYEFEHKDESHLSVVNRSIVTEEYLIYSVSFFVGPTQIFCRDLETGEIVWQKEFNLSDEVYPLTYAYGNIYAQLGDHSESRLVCYDVKDGTEIWSTDFRVQFQETNGPVVYKDKVYIVEGYHGPEIGAYDVLDGQLIWKKKVDQNYKEDNWHPVFLKDTLYAYHLSFNAFDPSDGATYYTIDEDEIPFEEGGLDFMGSPVVDTFNHQIIISSSNYIHALSLGDKEINWTVTPGENGNYFNASPALYGNKIYAVNSNYLNEYNATTGELLWQYEFESLTNFGASPVVNNEILVASEGDKTIVFDRSTHEILMTYPLFGELTLGKNELVISSKGKIAILDKERPNSVSHNYKPDFIKLYPSLTKGRLYLESTRSLDKIGIEIYNSVGKRVISSNSRNWTGNTFSLTNQPSGYYFVHISNDEFSFVEKVFLVK